MIKIQKHLIFYNIHVINKVGFINYVIPSDLNLITSRIVTIYFPIKHIKMIQNFNFLIIGRSGSGKSATTAFLTGNSQIQSKISPNGVTKSVKYYQSTQKRIHETKMNICVLDIPGLDELQQRKTIRQTIFNQLQTRKIEINAIIYTIDCVARDTGSNEKIFRFLNQLPWCNKDIKDNLFPVLTKYDNLIFDAEDENTQNTLIQFSQFFNKNGYGQSWRNNVLYWVNNTKNIIKKMNTYQEIREVYQNQVQNLIYLTKKKKSKLTYVKIEQFLQDQIKYLDQRIKFLIKNKLIPFQTLKYSISYNLKIQLSKNLNTKNFTAFTIGSFGIIVSKVCKNNFIKGSLTIASLISSGLIIGNCINSHDEVSAQKQKQQYRLNLFYPENYLIMRLNQLILHKFQQLERGVEFKIQKDILRVNIPQEFDGQYFLIQDIICYFQDNRMLKESQVGVFSYKIQDTRSKILQADFRMQLQVRIPHQISLLTKLEQQSSKFKQNYDKFCII